MLCSYLADLPQAHAKRVRALLPALLRVTGGTGPGGALAAAAFLLPLLKQATGLGSREEAVATGASPETDAWLQAVQQPQVRMMLMTLMILMLPCNATRLQYDFGVCLQHLHRFKLLRTPFAIGTGGQVRWWKGTCWRQLLVQSYAGLRVAPNLGPDVPPSVMQVVVSLAAAATEAAHVARGGEQQDDEDGAEDGAYTRAALTDLCALLLHPVSPQNSRCLIRNSEQHRKAGNGPG